MKGYEVLKDGKIVKACPLGKYRKRGKCSRCARKCDKCKSRRECTKCAKRRVLYKGKCKPSCPDDSLKRGNVCILCAK